MSMTVDAKNFSNALWGTTEDDVHARERAYQHLRNVKAGSTSYDLHDLPQLEKFLLDIADGCLDGKAGAANGNVAASEGCIIVSGDDGTQTVYNLANPKDLKEFLLDAADGTIDGRIHENGKSTDGSTPTGDTTSDGGRAAETGGSGGADEPAPNAAKDNEDAQKKHLAAMAYARDASPQAILDGLRNGTLPQSVLDDPSAMQMMMVKVQEYQRMMEMISNMLKLQHEMLMSIARNFPKG